MASLVGVFEGAEAKRVLNAAGNLVITAPAGGKKLRRMSEQELIWLREMKGRPGNLHIGRKALKP